jgi:hypothetical protein
MLSVFVHQLMHNWIVLKTILNLTLKLTLKGSYMFRCEEHHPQGAHYLSLAKVIIVNWSEFRPVPHTYTNKDQTIKCVPLASEPGWLADRCSVSQQLGALQTHTTDTFLFISHTTNVPLFKFRCNIVICVRIIKEVPGSVVCGTPCICGHTAE